MVRRLFQIFSPGSRRESAYEAAREKHLDTLEKHGIQAHLCLPSIGIREDEELCKALDFLAANGYIMTTTDGGIVGKVAKARLSSQEKAEQKRATFKIVD